MNKKTVISLLVFSLLTAAQARAAIVPDRTRIIYSSADKSVSVTMKNDNESKPYLAQVWLENDRGEKISSPLVTLPPVQRIEAKSEGQVKIQGLPAAASLPQDKESLFYFNVREIPPKSDQPNTLQIALQTRIKLFYRPEKLAKAVDAVHPWQHKVVLNRQGDDYQAINPTGYYVVLIDARSRKDAPANASFKPVTLAPGASQLLHVKASSLGEHPVMTYINDYGGRLPLYFNCQASSCQVDDDKSSKR